MEGNTLFFKIDFTVLKKETNRSPQELSVFGKIEIKLGYQYILKQQCDHSLQGRCQTFYITEANIVNLNVCTSMGAHSHPFCQFLQRGRTSVTFSLCFSA